MPTTKMSAAQKHAGRAKILADAEDWLKKEALSRKTLDFLSGCLDSAANGIESKNWDKAKIIRREFWFKTRDGRIYKRLYSRGEIVRMLNENGEKSKWLDVARGLSDVLKRIGALLEVVKIVRAIFNKDTFKFLASINEEVKKDPYKRGAREDSETLRRRAREGADKFIQLSDVVDNLTGLIPLPVIGDYVRYNFAILKGAEALFNTVEKYADRIVAEVKEVDKEWERAQKNKNSYWNYRSLLNNSRSLNLLNDAKY